MKLDVILSPLNALPGLHDRVNRSFGIRKPGRTVASSQAINCLIESAAHPLSDLGFMLKMLIFAQKPAIPAFRIRSSFDQGKCQAAIS
jgi:hypothetical protein